MLINIRRGGGQAGPDPLQFFLLIYKIKMYKCFVQCTHLNNEF